MSRRNPYAAHIAFARLAGRKTGLWRIIAVVVGFEFAFSFAPVVLGLAMLDDWASPAGVGLSTPAATILSFAMFAFAGLSLLVMVRLLHDRPPASLIGPLREARRDFLVCLSAVMLVLLVQDVVLLWLWQDDVVRVRPIGPWLLWLVPGLAALFIQVGTEELFFRGYLQQQIAAVTSRRLLWIGVPSLMFGLGHAANSNLPADALIWVAWATGLGFACADLTARTGTIGAATGLHLANNIFAVAVVGVEFWPGSGLALFLYRHPPGLDEIAPTTLSGIAFQLAIAFAGLLVMWLAARVALRR